MSLCSEDTTLGSQSAFRYRGFWETEYVRWFTCYHVSGCFSRVGVWDLPSSPEEVIRECSDGGSWRSRGRVCLLRGGRGRVEDGSWPNVPGRLLGILAVRRTPGSAELHMLYISNFQLSKARPKIKFQVKLFLSPECSFLCCNKFIFSSINCTYHDHQGVTNLKNSALL